MGLQFLLKEISQSEEQEFITSEIWNLNKHDFCKESEYKLISMIKFLHLALFSIFCKKKCINLIREKTKEKDRIALIIV